MIYLLGLLVQQGSESLDSVFVLVYIPGYQLRFEGISMAKISDIHCSVVIRLWKINSRGVNIISGHIFFITLVYSNIRKQFELIWNLKSPQYFSSQRVSYLPTLCYYLCFILYDFVTSHIINIKNCHNKKVSEYRPWPV